MTKTHPSSLSFKIAFLGAFFAGMGFIALPLQTAQAQEAPPSDTQLRAPGADVPIIPPADMPAQPNSVRNTGARAGGAGDPCPTPEGALNSAPDDLAKVQEDIDRFTLCVQRAQLLERLNESATKNSAAEDFAMGFNPGMAAGIASAQQNGMPGMGGAMPGNVPGNMMMGAGNMPGIPNGMPALPANALGGADVTPTARPNLPAGIVNAAGSPDATDSVPEARKEPEKPKEWTIREVFGSGSEVRARLLSPDGDEVRAYNGMRLPDGKTTIVRITPSGVTVRGEKGAQTLEWSKI